jgi:FAD/FMN-containing dehydrogenase
MRPSRARTLLAALRSIGELALARGGKIYTMSVEPDPIDLAAQYGGALESFRASKELLDPDGLLSPGLLSRAPGLG